MADRLGLSAWWFVDLWVTSDSDMGRGHVYDVLKVIGSAELTAAMERMMQWDFNKVPPKKYSTVTLKFWEIEINETNFIDLTQKGTPSVRAAEVQDRCIHKQVLFF